MSQVATPAISDEDDIFSASAYALNIPELDGRKATNLDIRFSGAGQFDRTSSDDLALLEAARIGKEVRFIVVGKVSAKAFRLSGTTDENLAYSCTVRVSSVEAAEIA